MVVTANGEGVRVARVARALTAVFPLAFLVAAGWLYREGDRSADLVAHTLEVKSAAADAMTQMLDAETGQRGFLITGDPAYLAPYDRARNDIDDPIGRLAALVADDPEQTRRVERFRAEATQQYEQQAVTVALARAGLSEAATARVRAGLSKALMDAMRVDVAEILAAENALLGKRRASAARLRLLGLAPILLGALALAALTWREMRARRREAADLRAYGDTLNRLVAERTQDLERERARVEALLRDVTHRVGNNLAMIAALLNIQRRRADDVRVKDALEEVASRIHAMAAGQRRLFLDLETDEVAGKPYLENLLAELGETAAARGVAIVPDLEDVRLPGKDAVSYIILLNELITNALKHAFVEGEGGQIRVRLREAVSDERPCVRIEVEDDGRGLPGGEVASGLGQKILRSLLTSMGGTLAQEPVHPSAARPGLRWILIVPRPSPSGSAA